MVVEPQYTHTDINGRELSEEEREYLQEKEIELDPLIKHNWKSAESRDRWGELLSDVPEARSVAEWKSVLSDKTDRKAAVVHISHNNRDEWLERISNHDLHYRQIRYTKPYDGYAHKVRRANPKNPERRSYAVVAQNADIADKFVEAENDLVGGDRHNVVGELLGFPDCCIEHFNQWWVKEKRRDPLYEMACNSDNAEMIDGDPNQIRIVDPEPWANVLFKYRSWSYLTHIPCSFDCEESIEIAKARGEIMAEEGYSDEANALYNWLSLPGVWSGFKKQVRMANEHMLGATTTSNYWNKKRIVWGEEHPDESVV